MGSGQGLAIRTTFSQLKEAFHQSKADVSAGMIKYVDYETHNIDPTNMYNLGIVKRRSFEHERELRVLVMEPSDSPGIYVDVDLSSLIQSVIISPGSPSWFYDVVARQADSRGLRERVIRSSLFDHPDYLMNFLKSNYGT